MVPRLRGALEAGADFLVNITLDTAKRVTGAFAGHPLKAHLQGGDFLSRHCIHTLEAPLDCNLYQSAKGLSGVSPAVREGGVILIASECWEGFGSEARWAVVPDGPMLILQVE